MSLDHVVTGHQQLGWHSAIRTSAFLRRIRAPPRPSTPTGRHTVTTPWTASDGRSWRSSTQGSGAPVVRRARDDVSSGRRARWSPHRDQPEEERSMPSARGVGTRGTALDPYAGHGTFIAGVVHQVCPDAALLPVRVLRRATARASEWDFARSLERLLEFHLRGLAGVPGYYPVDVVVIARRLLPGAAARTMMTTKVSTRPAARPASGGRTGGRVCRERRIVRAAGVPCGLGSARAPDERTG